MRIRRVVLRLVLLVVIATGVVVAALYRDQFDPETFDAWLSAMGIWAPLIFVVLYAIGTVAFVPATIFALAGGALFGPVLGAMFNLIAATIGSILAFLVARYLAGEWVARKARGRLKNVIQGVEAEGWRFVAFVRLVPLFPFNLVNYLFGLTRINLLVYAVASFVCMAPAAIAYTWLGHAGREALAGEASAIRYGLMALGLLAAIVFLPRLIAIIRGRRKRLPGDGDRECGASNSK